MIPGQPHVVLAVDDEPDILKMIREALPTRYQVLTAESVEEAEPLLRNHPVEVLICDDTMPGETGLMFMARIRNEFPFTRRILLTGNIDPDILIYAINEADLHRFVTKPFRAAELEKLVAEGVAIFADLRATELAVRENSLHRHDKPSTAPKPRDELWNFSRLLFLGLIVIGTLFSIGTVSIIILYFLKSFLGIDLFADVHFKDFFR